MCSHTFTMAKFAVLETNLYKWLFESIFLGHNLESFSFFSGDSHRFHEDSPVIIQSFDVL